MSALTFITTSSVRADLCLPPCFLSCCHQSARRASGYGQCFVCTLRVSTMVGLANLIVYNYSLSDFQWSTGGCVASPRESSFQSLSAWRSPVHFTLLPLLMPRTIKCVILTKVALAITWKKWIKIRHLLRTTWWSIATYCLYEGKLDSSFGGTFKNSM